MIKIMSLCFLIFKGNAIILCNKGRLLKHFNIRKKCKSFAGNEWNEEKESRQGQEEVVMAAKDVYYDRSFLNRIIPATFWVIDLTELIVIFSFFQNSMQIALVHFPCDKSRTVIWLDPQGFEKEIGDGNFFLNS